MRDKTSLSDPMAAPAPSLLKAPLGALGYYAMQISYMHISAPCHTADGKFPRCQELHGFPIRSPSKLPRLGTDTNP